MSETYDQAIARAGKLIAEQQEEIERLTNERDELLFALDDVVDQACWVNLDDLITLDSGAITAYANGMRLLAKYGLIVIESDVGRRVLGRREE